jgi:hypothetical protein
MYELCAKWLAKFTQLFEAEEDGPTGYFYLAMDLILQKQGDEVYQQDRNMRSKLAGLIHGISIVSFNRW